MVRERYCNDYFDDSLRNIYEYPMVYDEGGKRMNGLSFLENGLVFISGIIIGLLGEMIIRWLMNKFKR